MVINHKIYYINYLNQNFLKLKYQFANKLKTE